MPTKKQQSKKGAKVVNNTDEPKFKDFLRLPYEIQLMIVEQAVRKPGLHYLELRKKMTAGFTPIIPRWSLAIYPLSKTNDKSAFRAWKTFTEDKVFEGTVFAKAADNMLKDCIRVPLPRLEARFDPDTDLVCFEFNRGKNFMAVAWTAHANPNRADISAIRRTLRPFRKVALKYNANSRTRTFLLGLTNPFPCWCPALTAHQHGKGMMCPVEVANFLDCFDNLQEFYLIVTPADKESAITITARYEKRKYRAVDDLARFHDVAGTIWEATTNPRLKNERYYEAQASRIFNRLEIEYKTHRNNAFFLQPQGQRNEVKFRLLVEPPKAKQARVSSESSA